MLDELDKNFDEWDLCITAICMHLYHQDLHKIRPSNMYPPVGFYPKAYDEFRRDHDAMFNHKFRFRLVHFHRMLKAIDFEGRIFIVGSA